MAAALKLTITAAGRAALVNAGKNGTNAVVITQVGVTQSAFTPDPSMTKVPSELKRLTTISGGATDANTMHVTIRDNSADQYSLFGVGLYLADGTLFAVYSQATLIGQKSPQAALLVAMDVKFADINANSLTFGDTNFQLNVATTDVVGVVRLALNSDAIAGTDNAKAMTPASTKAVLDDRLGASAPTAFVKTLLALADAPLIRKALAIKSAALSDAGANNGLDADLLDGQHGDFYLQFANMKGMPPTYTPSAHQHAMSDIVGLAAALAAKLDATSRYVPGQIVVSASKAAPPNTLLCNGAAISRTAFAALFAAIGTTYGGGDGNTTFNVPSLGEGTVIKATVDANKVGTYSVGSLLTHTHGATAAAVGDHSHGFTINPAGAHGHGASSGGVGDHAHSAWTDAQGWHTHVGWTDAQGNHQHLTHNIPAGGAVGGAGGSPTPQRIDVWTDAAGNHSHNISTDGQGSHGHNIGMNGAGSHAHDIYIAGTGDHNHAVAMAGAGNHTHTLTIAAAGGADNLAAGTHMYHFIAI